MAPAWSWLFSRISIICPLLTTSDTAYNARKSFGDIAQQQSLPEQRVAMATLLLNKD